MRLLHVVPTYLPAVRYGGPIVSVHGLARALVSRGHQVTVFTTNVDGEGTSAVETGVPVDVDGVQVHYFPSEWRRLYVSLGLRRALRSSVREFDLVHLHSVFLDPTAAAARTAHRAGLPYIVSPRGMLVPELIERKSRVVKTAWLRLFERKSFRRAAGIHFTSTKEWDDAARVAISLPSPFVVPNGIDLPVVSGAPRDEATILFLGRVNWKKSIETLIEAIVLLPSARLIVAGNDEEHASARLGELARSLGVARRVEFTGAVTGRAKDELLSRATVFALTSMSENFGNAVLEAMAWRIPVVVTEGVGLAEDVRRSESGVVVPRNPAAVAAAIDSFLRFPSAAREAGACGRALVEQRFTWTAVAAEMEAHYARLLR